MENISVVDEDDKIFPIRYDENDDVDLELTYTNGAFHLIGSEGYVVFTDKSCLLKSDNGYYIKYDDDIVSFNEEEYEMIIAAMKICRVE